VIAQTSNDRLDELNARAQAIRIHDNQIDPQSIPVAGRPYGLHRDDEVQIRRTIDHPQHGALRNGTTGHVTEIDSHSGLVDLRLSDRRQVMLDSAQMDRADVRLAYVQHPFPAQAQTTDIAHMILAEHTTKEGAYVAITRARESTRIYAGLEQLHSDIGERDPVHELAERMSRTEPELPSIHTPLAHEQVVNAEHAQTLTRGIGENHAKVESREQPRQLPPPHLLTVLGPQPAIADPSPRGVGPGR
jgi:ATP-dependent exoDNAse (exonuclease V) alpha subunit